IRIVGVTRKLVPVLGLNRVTRYLIVVDGVRHEFLLGSAERRGLAELRQAWDAEFPLAGGLDDPKRQAILWLGSRVGAVDADDLGVDASGDATFGRQGHDVAELE